MGGGAVDDPPGSDDGGAGTLRRCLCARWVRRRHCGCWDSCGAYRAKATDAKAFDGACVPRAVAAATALRGNPPS